MTYFSRIKILKLGLLLQILLISAQVSQISRTLSESAPIIHQPKAASTSTTVLIEDMFGREVSVPSNVTKIIGVGAGALRYIVYMNGTSRVCAVENIELEIITNASVELRPYNLAHPELRDLPSIGPQWGGDKELIAAADPDVVITTNEAQASDIDDLETALGIPVVGLIYGDLISKLDLLWEGLNITATILGTQDHYLIFKNYVESILDDLSSRTGDIEDINKRTCYVGGIGYRGVHGIDSTKPIYDPFALVEAKNVAGDLEQANVFVDAEQILEWNPDVLFIDGGGFALMYADLESGIYDSLQAIEKNEVYVLLPYNWYTANFANILIDAYYIGTILFPTEFSDINIDSKAAEIYEQMVGQDVLATLKTNFKTSSQTTQEALTKVSSLEIDKSIPGYSGMVIITMVAISLFGITTKIKKHQK